MRLPGVLTTITLLIAASVGHAQVPTKNVAATEKNRVSLTISTKENTFKLGAPIPVAIVVKNVSNGEYCELHLLETGKAEMNGYLVDVRDSDGKTYPRILQQGRPRGSIVKLCLSPGELRKESLSVDQIVNLTAPGTYVIRVEHLDREANIHMWSNSISVTITP
jgi:hypothetical protein